MTIPATFGCGQVFCAIVHYTFTVSDPDDAPDQISVTCAIPDGATRSWGTSMDSCQAKDPAGNLSQPVSFTLTVTIPDPTFQSVPGPLTFPAAGPAGGPATFATPTAVDVSGQSVPVTCDHLSGITYPIGVTTVTCTAQIMRNDSQGTPIGGLPSATTQFTVTITTGSGGGGAAGGGGGGAGGGGGGGGGGSTSGDTSPPTIQSLRNLRLNATGALGAAVRFVVVATDPDNTADQLVTSCLPASGSTFRLGARAATHTSVVTCKAHDLAGNEAVPMSFDVTILGAHDQLLGLQNQVIGGRQLATAARVALVAGLQKADRFVHSGARARANTQLGAFIVAVGKASRLSLRTRTRWTSAAARIIAVY